MERLLRPARSGLVALAALALLVREGPMHGYGLRKRLGELVGEEPPESTVYDALKKLEKLSLIKSYWAMSPAGTMRKYYYAAPGAEEALREAIRSLRALAGWLLCGDEHRDRGDSHTDSGSLYDCRRASPLDSCKGRA